MRATYHPAMRARLLPMWIALACLACGAPQRDAQRDEATSCEALIEEYRVTLAGGDGSCESDADCELYGGVDPNAICGGVTDARTAAALRDVSAAMDEASCPRAGYSCPAIDARCVEHVCR